MAATLSLPLKDRVLRDVSNLPVPCFCCKAFLATVFTAGRPTCTDCQERVIRGLDACGARLKTIVTATQTSMEYVMRVLGADYYCHSCGRPADLAAGVPDEDWWVSGCCGDVFMDAQGTEYSGDYRWRYAE